VVQSGELGINIENQGSCTSNLIPDSTIWPKDISNYSVEFDITFVKGTDHNFIYRVPSGYGSTTSTFYEIHFTPPGGVGLMDGIPHTINVENPRSFSNGETYHVRVDIEENNVKLYIDNQLIKDYTAIDDIPPGRIGLRGGTGADPNSETYYDNIIVTSSEINVPPLKQTDPAWGSQVYDSADLWSPNDPSIGSYGCAMTSATMVLQYYGIQNLPDGTPLNPGSLNTWLKGQPDGYVDGGLLNWLAITKLAKQAGESAYNPGFTYDSLEFKWGGNDTAALIDDLTNNIPDILEEHGHFIVAKGVDGNSFAINDPYYNRESLNDYGDTFLSTRRYIPANSDLSYLQFVVDKNVTVKLTNANGNDVGEQHIEEPLENDNNPGSTTGEALKIVLLPKPTTGTYHLTLSSPTTTSYHLSTYMYTQDADVNMFKDFGFLDNDKQDTYTLNFDKTSKDKNTRHKDITFATMIADVKEGVSLNLIKETAEKSMLSLLENAQNDVEKHHPLPAQNKLEALGHELNAQKGKAIQEEAYSILTSDLSALEDSLR
jgi:hypothetical protein